MTRLPLKFAIVRTQKSQRQIAAEAGLSENRISEIVRGWRNPRDSERRALASVLGVSVDKLFKSKGR